MAVRRLTQIFFILTVCATLLVSSVAACACDHNRLAKVEAEPSCHASSHTEPAADIRSDNDRVDVGCNCFVSDTQVAALGRSETKKQKLSIDVASAAASTSAFTPAFRSNESRTVSPHTQTTAYSQPYGRSAPSRGPPLL